MLKILVPWTTGHKSCVRFLDNISIQINKLFSDCSKCDPGNKRGNARAEIVKCGPQEEGVTTSVEQTQM